MFRVQYRVGNLIDAIHKRAPKTPEWTSEFLDEVFEKVYSCPPPKRLVPSDLQTWDYLFGFWTQSRNQALSYLVRPRSDKPAAFPITLSHLKRMDIAIHSLGLVPDEKSFQFGDSLDQSWWDFLDLAWRAIAGDVAPPDPDFSKSLSILGAAASLGKKLFVGRETAMTAIEAKLGPINGDGKTPKVALHGLGGIGKTRLAVEYAHSKIGSYGPIIFIGADTPANLEQNILDAVRSSKFQIKPLAADYSDAKNAFAQWLEEHKRWLVIFDNVDTDDAAEAVQQLFPILFGGHVLITARISQWHVESRVETLEIDALLFVDASIYLDYATENRKVKLNSDKDDALKLATSLGGVPSLLTYAAGYILHGTISFKAYHDKWNTKRADKDAWWSEEKSKRITGYPTPQAATTWQTSVDILLPPARQVFDQLAWFAPDRIPRALFLNEIPVDDLIGYSLVTPVGGNAFTINSALQEITRVNLEATKSFESLSYAARTLEAGLNAHQEHLIPHVLSVLHFLRDDRFIDFTEADLLDSMGRIAVLALAQTVLDGTKYTKQLITVLSVFYEVEPLEPILWPLVLDSAWDEIQTQLLAANNYVLRYAMAEAISQKWDIPEIVKLFEQSTTLNEFELGGYALGLVFAGDPSLIASHRSCLVRLAECPAYGGRSILGDLFLNLVFRKDLQISRELRGLATDRFWKRPLWDFIKLDIDAIEAAEAFVANPEAPPPNFHGEVLAAFNIFDRITNTRNNLIVDFKPNSEIEKLLRGYFRLGDEPNQVKASKDELEALSTDILLEIMRLFFSHPIWAVAESAATVLSSLVEREDKRDERIQIIHTLLGESENWRVQFGANEAAFAVRHVAPEVFDKSLDDNYTHKNCKIRGLCAENLISLMLNSSSKKRNSLYVRFKPHIAAWVQDQDCWVLEHVFRLFNTLEKRKTHLLDVSEGQEVGVDPGVLAQGSRLFGDKPNWWKGEREEFLQYIEDVKNRMGDG